MLFRKLRLIHFEAGIPLALAILARLGNSVADTDPAAQIRDRSALHPNNLHYSQLSDVFFQMVLPHHSVTLLTNSKIEIGPIRRVQIS